MNLAVQSNLGKAAIGMNGGTVTIKKANREQTYLQRMQRQNNKGGKKQLNYNPREISAQIMRAAKSRNAMSVLSKARNNVASLQRCLKSGQYNTAEVEAAIAHAKRMVKCAQLKVNNLKSEEDLKRKNEREHVNTKQQKKNEIKRRINRKESELKQKAEIEEMQFVIKEKANRRELIRKRKMHRNQERSKIAEADIKYLQDQTGMRSDTYTGSSGVSLEISSMAMGLHEIQMSEHAAQLLESQTMTVEAGMEASMDAGTGAAVDISI